MNARKKLISIITPVYNEEENIKYYYDRITKALDVLQNDYDFEFIITDNCSTDRSFELLREIANDDKRFRIFKLSRNFGYQKSIWTAYCQARGDAVIEFDCDLQDPPELLPQFIKKWEDGYKIIYGVRDKRSESFFKTKQIIDLPYVRKLFYKFLNAVSDVNMPENAGDFILMDKIILNLIQNISDHNIYLRGTIFSLGFQKIGIPYVREKRIYGKTKFNFFKSLKLALDGIVSQSVFPLKVATVFGIIIAFVTMLLSFFYLFSKLFWDINLPDGFTTTIVLILFGISMNGLFLGIIGEYIARIYAQQKNIPITIIEDKINNIN